MTEATFNVYGRLLVHLTREPDGMWRAAEVGYEGKRRPLPDILVPDHAGADDLAGYLEACFHEIARPGERIERVG